MGSENGMPNSIISAPSSGKPSIILSEVSKSGSPAVIKMPRAEAFLISTLKKNVQTVTGVFCHSFPIFSNSGKTASRSLSPLPHIFMIII